MPRFALCCALFSVCLAWSQTVAKPNEFEIVSIKAANPGERRSSGSIDAGENLTMTNRPLRGLITFAYDIRDFQLAGAPAWVGDSRYDIRARVARESTEIHDPDAMSEEARQLQLERTRERMRHILADRFGLVIHHNSKEETVYLLEVAKSGSRLQPPKATAGQRGTYIQGGKIEGFAASTALLAKEISGILGRPVQDRTGLSGTYDFTLEWTADDVGSATDGTAPSVFTAVQEQLGLRLVAAKRPVDIIVIDEVRQPSAN